ncbi:hypothetical protein GCM10007036_21400 [Alsobacter metallidurans]|uniref:Uncharacterized protein n=1 Tax=Alsobacter metallidurans TaxID=340221 RepID=A0A917I687_9HYPH|nr:hypothetical protein [Alsobacter metallidurans]GGH18913.1 hypothetical protein GCM10007036_21400 [Alsobacter metallidurans]
MSDMYRIRRSGNVNLSNNTNLAGGSLANLEDVGSVEGHGNLNAGSGTPAPPTKRAWWREIKIQVVAGIIVAALLGIFGLAISRLGW